jgi:tetratricopeptide (TPR) repeat protein
MAWEGVKERPILGWGQENFSYVFNKYYDPALYGAEPWYDRTHNIFLDWLIAGGVLGLVAYLSILGAALWYVIVRPVFERFWSRGREKDQPFTLYEQALILGLLAAYMFHNLFVFDNLGSWIFYGVLLALVHSRVSTTWDSLSTFTTRQDTWHKVTVPAVFAILALAIYFINIPSILAARDIIDAYRAPNVEAKLQEFAAARERGGFAAQEIFEQLSHVAGLPLAASDLPATDRELILSRVKEAMAQMKAEKPNDARVHTISANFYRAAGDLDNAMLELQTAETISPTKQAIIMEQGLIYLLANKKAEALERYQKAYELDRNDLNARVRLAAVALYFDERPTYQELLPPSELEKKEALWIAAVREPLMMQVAYQKSETYMVEQIVMGRVTLEPTNKDARVNLAAFYFEQGNLAKAREVIVEAINDMPSFKEEGEKLLEQINNGTVE